MSEKIEAVFLIADDGFSAWRAKGIVRRSLKELAQALDVEENEFKVQPDLYQLATEQRQLRRQRAQAQARNMVVNPWTGRPD